MSPSRQRQRLPHGFEAGLHRVALASLILLLGFLGAPAGAASPGLLARTASGFPLAAAGAAAPVHYDPADHPVVAHAAADLARDVAAVTGLTPRLHPKSEAPTARHVVIAGTLGRSRAIDALAASGRLDVGRLRSAWESFVIAVVERPAPGVASALVIAGSDPRGTAFGLYELSETIGVSPWSWWADVPARRRAELWIAAGAHRFGPPSVRYRGLFINDEDWGLQPWAARTHEPGAKGLGPKTYARVFELLLRLKANILWPAMHEVSPPFNADPANARLADDYAIVMGSSHAEPMLRNNIGEWTDAKDRFNYATNREGVRRYWEERVRTNAGYESLWTVGMRGIHDSGIVGADTVEGKIALLDRAIADQRALLARYVAPDVTRVPQMFMPYKEVLDLYRAGLKVPDDVTIVWPDDNFGYVRQFPSAAERARSGGSGIYYHLSYLGAPLSYLWLATTPPALINEEMTRAWNAGARTIWIANVGDIKPAEIGTSLFLEMAWDVERWRGRSQRAFLDDWAGRTFGTRQARAIGAVLDEHFRLNQERRPEHLQYWLYGDKPRMSPLGEAEIGERLARYARLAAALDRAAAGTAADQRDAFFELVDYPVRAAADANRRYFGAELAARTMASRPAEAARWAAAARAADARVKEMTRRFNEDVAGGKWRHLMTQRLPAGVWPRFSTAPLDLSEAGLRAMSRWAGSRTARCAGTAATLPRVAPGWRSHDGLGRSGRALVAAEAGAGLRLTATLPTGCRLALALVPTFPTEGETGFHLAVSANGGAARAFAVPRDAESPAWKQAVLDNRLLVPLPVLPAGKGLQLTLYSREAGLALDGLVLVDTIQASE
ncbi:glycosyl hydrolase 115 family protein [Sphingomonas parva]|uniref:glycosyl hydrolase 115 family protein n=1 Tax=Sphingomonas parva TaxID=2555898 RepID=UPI001CDC0BA7|nr:glycosyl hydrolase 115 family protein [Sphingomonas parva]